MKKIWISVCLCILFCSCAIFKKKDKYGCPGDATGKSLEQAAHDANKKKYKGGNKF